MSGEPCSGAGGRLAERPPARVVHGAESCVHSVSSDRYSPYRPFGFEFIGGGIVGEHEAAIGWCMIHRREGNLLRFGVGW